MSDFLGGMQGISFEQYEEQSRQEVEDVLEVMDDKLYHDAVEPLNPVVIRALESPSPNFRYTLEDTRTRYNRHHRHNFETHNKPQVSHMPPSFREWTKQFPYFRVRGVGYRVPVKIVRSPVPKLAQTFFPPSDDEGSGRSPPLPLSDRPVSTSTFTMEEIVTQREEGSGRAGGTSNSRETPVSSESPVDPGLLPFGRPPGLVVPSSAGLPSDRQPLSAPGKRPDPGAEASDLWSHRQSLDSRDSHSTRATRQSQSMPSSPSPRKARAGVVSRLPLPPPWARGETGQRIHSPLPWESPTLDWGGLVVTGTPPPAPTRAAAATPDPPPASSKADSAPEPPKDAKPSNSSGPLPGKKQRKIKVAPLTVPTHDVGGLSVPSTKSRLAPGQSSRQEEEVFAEHGEYEEYFATDEVPALPQPSVESPGLNDVLARRALEPEDGLDCVLAVTEESEALQISRSAEELKADLEYLAPAWADLSQFAPQEEEVTEPEGLEALGPSSTRTLPRASTPTSMAEQYAVASDKYATAPLSPVDSMKFDLMSKVLNVLWRDAILALQPLVCDVIAWYLENARVQYEESRQIEHSPDVTIYESVPSPVPSSGVGSDSARSLVVPHSPVFSSKPRPSDADNEDSPPLIFTMRSASSSSRIRSPKRSPSLHSPSPKPASPLSSEYVKAESLATPKKRQGSPSRWSQTSTSKMRMSPVQGRKPTPATASDSDDEDSKHNDSPLAGAGGDADKSFANSSIELEEDSPRQPRDDPHPRVPSPQADEYKFSVPPRVLPLRPKLAARDIGVSPRAAKLSEKPTSIPTLRQLPQSLWQLPNKTNIHVRNSRPGTADSQLKHSHRVYQGPSQPLGVEDKEKYSDRRPNTALPRQPHKGIVPYPLPGPRPSSTSKQFDRYNPKPRLLLRPPPGASHLGIVKEESGSSSRSSRVSIPSGRKSSSSRTASWHVDPAPSLPPISDAEASPLQRARKVQGKGPGSARQWLHAASHPPSRRDDSVEVSPMPSSLPSTSKARRGVSAAIDMKLQQLEEAFPVSYDATHSSGAVKSKAEKKRKKSRRSRKKREQEVTMVYSNSSAGLGLSPQNSAAHLHRSKRSGVAGGPPTRDERRNKRQSDAVAARRAHAPSAQSIEPARAAHVSWPLPSPRQPSIEKGLPQRLQQRLHVSGPGHSFSPLQYMPSNTSSGHLPPSGLTEERATGGSGARVRRARPHELEAKARAGFAPEEAQEEHGVVKPHSPRLVLPGVTRVNSLSTAYNFIDTMAYTGAKSPRNTKHQRSHKAGGPYTRKDSLARVYLGGSRRISKK